MKCLMIFDPSNDVLYAKYDMDFDLHLQDVAKKQDLILKDENASQEINVDILVHIFSPLITSQRIMACQFGNSYTSIQCFDGSNIAFEEYLGYLFVCIDNDDTVLMKRYLSICISIVRYICGPDISQIKNNRRLSTIITKLLNSWNKLKEEDQSMLVEAIEQLFLNKDVGNAVVKIMKESTEKLISLLDFPRVHMLLLVQNKFLSLYSSSAAQTLSPVDILFGIILKNNEDVQEKEFCIPKINEDTFTEKISSFEILLSGNEFIPRCIPHIVHVVPVTEDKLINLLCYIEVGKYQLATHLYDSFVHLHVLECVQIHREVGSLKPVVEELDNSIKKLLDHLKKMKSSSASLESKYKSLTTKWDFMKKNYMEYIKTQKEEPISKAESNSKVLLDILKDLLRLTSRDEVMLTNSQKHLESIGKYVKMQLELYEDFFKVKALKNFTLGSREDSLTMSKYLEEFPGLVHFIYIDRTNHRVITPTLNFTAEETRNLTKVKIWDMVNFSRNYVQEGHLSMMWKDTTFSYAYFLWFEEVNGSTLKPVVFPTNTSRSLPQPGILCCDFYRKLREFCFPKMNPVKVRCYELFCIHLGLVSASCVLEHTRRLSVTIGDLKGYPSNSLDI